MTSAKQKALTPRTKALQFDCNEGVAHSIDRMVVDANDYRILECELAAAQSQIAALHERLEDSFYFNAFGKRIEVKLGSIPDGISCRDVTIRLLEHRLEELEAKRKEDVKICAGAVESLKNPHYKIASTWILDDAIAAIHYAFPDVFQGDSNDR